MGIYEIIVILIIFSILVQLLYQVVMRAIDNSKLRAELKDIKQMLQDIQINQMLNEPKDEE